MNAQDKAKELVSKYYNYVSAWTVTNLPNEAPEAIYEGKKMKIGRAKQCALIAVDEMIKTAEIFDYCETIVKNYNEVKTEIEKL